MRLIDTTRCIETPEGIELHLHVAGPVVRALAWVLDFLIRLALYIAIAYFSDSLGDFGIGILLISIFLLEWFYPVLFEVYNHGATPGKRLLKLKVLRDVGLPVDWSASMLRNILRAADFLPFFYGFGLLSMILNQDFKRLGDIAAGTIVVYQDEPIKTNSLPNVPAQALHFPLPLPEQRAIIAFAERAPKAFSLERAEELADIVQPLTGRSGQAGVEILYQLANGLVGEKRLDVSTDGMPEKTQ